MLEWYQSILPWRVAFGVAVFAALALVDWRRNPTDPRRVREYAFLLYGTAVAAAYGVVHDQLTVTLSPEYFFVFKGLGLAEGALRWETLKLSVLATYWVGLVIAAALLVANNPSADRPQLPYARLRCTALAPIAAAALGAALGAAALGAGASASTVAAWTGYRPEAPARFLAVWGMHLGSYAGGALGGLAAVVSVRKGRRQLMAP